MSFFDKGLEGFLGAGSLGKISFDENQIRIILVDMDDAGPAPGAFKIRSVSGTSTVTVETGTSGGTVNHGLSVGDRFDMWGATGVTGVTGTFTVASVPQTYQFTFVPPTAASGTHTANTGYIADLSLTYLSQFVPSGGRIATSAQLTSKTVTDGVMDAADVVFSSVSGDTVEAWVMVRYAAQDGDGPLADNLQRLIYMQSPATVGLSGLPQTPSAGNINLTFASQGIAKL